MEYLRRGSLCLLVLAPLCFASAARAQTAPPPGYPPPGYPPPGYPPPAYPPPGYPPPAGYPYGYTPAPPRPQGLGLIIAGAVLLPLGLVLSLAAVEPLLDGYDLLPGSTPGYSSSDLLQQKVGVSLFAIGAVMSTAGIILLAVGGGQRQRWLRSRGQTFGANGLSIRF